MCEKELLGGFIDWISVDDRLPDRWKNVIAVQIINNFRELIIARYVHKYEVEYNMSFDELETEYDDETDCYYWKEGWYEIVRNWDDFTALYLLRGGITHWQPLPKLPE